MKLIAIHTTLPSAEQAHALARNLVESGLVACVQIEPIASVYTWQGAVEQASEFRLVCKTLQARCDDVMGAIRQRHPYDVPELLVFAVDFADPAYAQWAAHACQAEPPVPPSPTKAGAMDFLQRVAQGDVETAFAQYVAADFRHHNPSFRGDAASLQAAMQANAAQHPGKVLQVLHAMQEGDQVVVFSRIHLQPGDAGVAVVHRFRWAAGRIVELWDIGQPVSVEMANENGMF